MPALTQEQLDHFHTKGYVVVEDVVPDEVLDPLEDEYAMVLDSLANELFEDGVISSTYAGLPFSDRLTRVYQDSGTVHSGYFDFSMPQGEIKSDTPMWHGPAVFNTLTAPPILDAVESIIGPEIYSNPVQHVRLNPNPPMRSGLGVGTRGEGRGTRRSALDSDKWGRWRPLVVVGGADGGPGQRRWGGVGGTACRGRQSRTGPVRLCGSVG